jgi:hypothetical protein
VDKKDGPYSVDLFYVFGPAVKSAATCSQLKRIKSSFYPQAGTGFFKKIRTYEYKNLMGSEQGRKYL